MDGIGPVGVNMRKLTIAALSVVFVLAAAAHAGANPVVPYVYGWSSGDEALLVLTVSCSMLLEYLLVRWLLHPWAAFQQVFPAFLIVNAVSLPITLMLGMIMAWFAEVVPLVLEPRMYASRFGKIGVKVPRLGARIIAANLGSFAVGVAAP